MSPMERVLMEEDQVKSILRMRDTMMSKLCPEIKVFVQITTGVEIEEWYYDWGLHNRTGVIVGISAELFTDEQVMNTQYQGKDIIHNEILKISAQAEKRPEDLFSCQLNSRILMVIRNGIFVTIEKELIRLGYQDILKVAKRNMEKSFLHTNHNQLDAVLGKRVTDVFVDWNFDLDKSVIIYNLTDKHS
jgi:uncharacterized protein YbcI